MALSTKELSNLLTLLSVDNVSSNTLETITTAFHRNYSRFDHFRVGTALTLLLQQKDLLPISAQRIAALFVLHELYRSEPGSSNPFTGFFVELLLPTVEDDRTLVGLPCGHMLSPVERSFLLQLLTPQTFREIVKKSPATIANTELPPNQVPDSTTILQALHEPLEGISSRNKEGLSTVLADPDTTSSSHPDVTVAAPTAENLLCVGDPWLEQPFEPGFIRPLPPLHSCPDEVVWLNPTESQYSIQWDTLMFMSGTEEIRRLFVKACKETLNLQEQQALLSQLEADPKLVHQDIGLTPAKLPHLVEKNPTVAIEALLRLTTSSQISEYFVALVNMEMSVHSMDVVNRLTQAVDLPTEFLHLYINNCIQRCRDIQDKSLQSRLVRLVCVFLQSLIRNKVISVQDESLEIQPFCLEYSKIKEATALYRLLKQLDGGEGVVKP